MFPYRDSRLAKVAFAAFFLLLLGYAYFEARAMLYGPRIILPTETIVARTSLITIEGKAEHITELRMNGTPISVTEDGVFKESYLLTPGESRVVLDASDRYGRMRQKTVEIVYIPETPPPPPPEPASVATSTPAIAPEDQ